MDSFIHPIIGQEAVVSKYGLGRVVGLIDNARDKGIIIKPYKTNYTIKFDPDEVKLVKIDYE